MLVKNARFFYDGRRLYENVDVLITDHGAELGNDKTDEIISGEDRIVLPSFFNAHAHIPMLPLRGMHEDEEFHRWLTGVWEVEGKYEKKYFYPASLLSLAENVRNGITDVISMYFHVLETVKAAFDVGLRTYIGPVFMKADFLSESIEEKKKQIQKITGLGGPIVPTVFMHALYTADEETIDIVREIIERYDPFFQIHVSETREEVIKVREEWGDYPVRVLRDRGLLTAKTYLVHCGWLTASELILVKDAKSTLVHCPTSNLKLSTHGFFPWRECIELGINVKFGTDSQASNNTQDIIFEMRTAALIHKDRYWDSTVAGIDELFKAAKGSGWIVLDISSLRFFPSLRGNILANVVYNGCGEMVEYVFLDGKVLYPFPDGLASKLDAAKERVMDFVEGVYYGSH